MRLVGDFSLINPYGVRVKGSPLWSFRVKGCPSYWLGLRVFQSSGSGLRVGSPDDHVILLIPLYLTGGFHCPLSLIPSSPLTIDFLTTVRGAAYDLLALEV